MSEIKNEVGKKVIGIILVFSLCILLSYSLITGEMRLRTDIISRAQDPVGFWTLWLIYFSLMVFFVFAFLKKRNRI